MAKKEMKFYLRKSAFGLASVSAALLVGVASVSADSVESAGPVAVAVTDSLDSEAAATKAEADLVAAKAELAAAEAAITAAKADFDTAQADLATAEATIAGLEQKMAELESKIQETQKKLDYENMPSGGGLHSDDEDDTEARRLIAEKEALKAELQKTKESLEVAKKAYAGIEERKQVAAVKLDAANKAFAGVEEKHDQAMAKFAEAFAAYKEAVKAELKAAGASDFYTKKIDSANTVAGVKTLREMILDSIAKPEVEPEAKP
ncbi:TPA: YSIRK-type signal peptide-containing protein, partial [Streptococcus equi subsp. zooepidemicus]|nr:YSIRK-type signal peptide-containing protein [Streptococcus equi subsp. zooepidemicus]HEL0357550.1 YSIRK-type signal peptide-containing protein [Streptococcus equi subsp. zooepidemicus]